MSSGENLNLPFFNRWRIFFHPHTSPFSGFRPHGKGKGRPLRPAADAPETLTKKVTLIKYFKSYLQRARGMGARQPRVPWNLRGGGGWLRIEPAPPTFPCPCGMGV